MVKHPLANSGNVRDSVRSLGGEDPLEEGSPPQYSCLENPIGRGAMRPVGYSPWGCSESDTCGDITCCLESIKCKAMCAC